MNVLLIGGGGREHALAWKMAASPKASRLFAAPGSAAIAQVARCVTLEGHDAIAAFAARESVDLVVVGPEAPLVEGLGDALAARSIPVFGPSAAAARLEGSKAFAKAFMARHGIPTAAHHTFSDPRAALAHLEQHSPPYVVKADGLAAGKGVMISHTREEARAAVRAMMADQVFGGAGRTVVIEQFLAGEEASYFIITDGQDFVTLPPCQDHKTIGELDHGPNTGGMGAYCPAPVVTAEVERRVIEEIVRPTLAGMAAEGHPYRGVLYIGLMIENGRPSVVEYNCRFGDPECQPLMLLLESDLVELMEAAAKGRLGTVRPRWRTGAAACIVMASGGYPGDYPKGLEITGLERVEASERCQVFHAGTRREGARWLTNGGRVLGVTAWGPDLAAALARGYRAVEEIEWKGAVYRRDIGLKGLRHEAARRPGVNVALAARDTAALETGQEAAAWLEKLGIGVQAGTAPRDPSALRAWLRACESAGAEVILALPGGDPSFAQGIAGLSSCLAVAPLPPGAPPAPYSGPAAIGVCWAAGGPFEAALLAAQLLALKYPDVWAALRHWRLERELSGRPAPSGKAVSTLS